MTSDDLLALGFTRQSKTMWRNGDITWQNGKFYDKQGNIITTPLGDINDRHDLLCAEEGEKE